MKLSKYEGKPMRQEEEDMRSDPSVRREVRTPFHRS